LTKIEKTGYPIKLLLAAFFAVAFAYVEASVVVYLRELIYPDGFSLPLREIPSRLTIIELSRELATMMMLIIVAAILARQIWERFAYFIFTFGIWDIFYYVWLKATINWPDSLAEWDVLFLLPLPWIGPVIAPVSISVLMIVVGILVLRQTNRGAFFRPPVVSWVMALAATALILYSFLSDTDATLWLQMPQSYNYPLLIASLLIYVIGFAIAYRSAGRTLSA